MNYYEIKYLKEFLKIKLVGSRLVHSNTRYKNLLEFFVENQSAQFRLVYSTAPGNIALYLDQWANPKKSNTISFFEELYEEEITDITMAETDRVLKLHFGQDRILWFKLFSNRANVMLVEGGQVKESFKGANEEDIRLPEVKQIDLMEGPVKGNNPKQKITLLNPLFPRNNLDELIRIHGVSEMSDEELRSWVREFSSAINEKAYSRLLENGNTTLFNEELLGIKTARTFDTVNDLIAYRYKTYSHDQRLKQRKSGLLKKLKLQRKRTKSSLGNLSNADKGLERAEEYEKYGHLLMANGHRSPEKDSQITVNDLYEEGKEVTIPLDEKLSVIENAERYYDKSRGSLKSYEQALKRKPELEKKAAKINELLEELEDINWLRDLQDWEKDHKEDLKELNVLQESGNQGNDTAFHNLEISGYPVWIGKNARNNDLLVQMGHKEDVWLHARGVAGSHVLIRMGNSKELPPKAVILEAAACAAYNSKARGSEVVPVIYTKKKYVRKPKGAAAGAVVVDREEVEFVKPAKPEL